MGMVAGGGVGGYAGLKDREEREECLKGVCISVVYTPVLPSSGPHTPYLSPVVMDSLDAEQLSALQKAFDSFDTDSKGFITPETVGVILRMMGVKISEKNLQEVISETDEDGSGELEFEEFVELAAKFLIEEDEEALKAELREAFRVYDKGGNGYITTDVLKEILRELDNRLTEEDLDSIIEEVDEDGSGTLDFDEFMQMMNG
ncbi:Troponin C-like 10 [Homarus americanus]|uniref:Troponin C-like 10 n=2 Tax=Homarus americanus TaxID=6706 RepID=A0A8J5JLI6_HOMAM|nr:Troponin C-like 10 [Homarus americanus]